MSCDDVSQSPPTRCLEDTMKQGSVSDDIVEIEGSATVTAAAGPPPVTTARYDIVLVLSTRTYDTETNILLVT